MNIISKVTKDNLSKEQIEYLQKQQKEYKLIKKIRKIHGHTLFSFNKETGEIKQAVIKNKVLIGLNGCVITKQEIIIESDCYYEQALNKTNFIKRLKKNKIILYE